MVTFIATYECSVFLHEVLATLWAFLGNCIESVSKPVLFFYPLQANINGRVLTHCNLDELKKEMEMNFGDWQLFRGMVRLDCFI